MTQVKLILVTRNKIYSSLTKTKARFSTNCLLKNITNIVYGQVKNLIRCAKKTLITDT